MSYEKQLRQPVQNRPVTPRNAPGQPERRGPARGRVTIHLALTSLTIILLGAAGGLGAALVWPKTYGARAEILCVPNQDEQGGDPLVQDPQLSTQLVMLKSPAVLAPIARKQGKQFDDLNSNVSAQILDNSDVIQVDVDGPTSAAALQTLQAVTDSYLGLAAQPSGVARNLDLELASAHATTTQLQTRVQQLTTAVVAKTATQASLNDARAQLTAAQDQETAIQSRIDQLDLTGQTGPDAQLLTPPYALPDPVSPQPLVATGIGALVGAIPASAVVALAVRRRTTPGQPRRTPEA